MANITFFITSTGWGGLEMNIVKLIKGLTGLKHNVSLITSNDSKLYNEAKGCCSNIAQIKTPRKYFDFKSAKAIAKVLKNNKTEIVFVDDNRDLDVITWVKRLHLRRLKIIYHQQMQIGVNKKDLLHTFRFRAIDYWISPLNWLKKEVGNNTKYPVERVKVVPYSVAMERLSQRKYSKEEARKRLNIRTNVALIGIIGRISKKKGQDFIIKAISELTKKGKEVELLVFGSATINDPECQNYEQEIKQYVLDNNLIDVVHFREFSPEIELFYNAIDVFTIASESETFGLVTIEAMVSELPVIAANTGGSPEILDNGKYGCLYQYGDINSFCKQYEWIDSNRAKAVSQAKMAKGHALAEYSLDKELKRTSDIIDLTNTD